MKKYWRSLEELDELNSGKQIEKDKEPEFSVEDLSPEEIKGLSTTRRDFLKVVGFTAGYAAIISGCRQPVRKAIPYLNRPEEVTPGMANYYASSYYDGHDFSSIVVKVRDGRPIKIEGNELFPLSGGGTNARVQASVLSLYDSYRLQNPLKNGKKISWQDADSEIISKLESITGQQGKISILSSSVISPSTNAVLKKFQEKFPGTEVVFYDDISFSAIRMANDHIFGKPVIPYFKFDQADIIVGFNCDFLGTWLMPAEFSYQYSKTRELGETRKTLSKHFQFESWLSLTGSNADERIPIKPEDEAQILADIYARLAVAKGRSVPEVPHSAFKVDHIVKLLIDHPAKSIVVSGTNDVNIQSVVSAINHLCDNFSTTIDMNNPVQLNQGSDSRFIQLVEEMNQGSVKGLILYDVNPVYSYNEPGNFISGLKKVELTVSLSQIQDETSVLVEYICPDNHFLESWNDFEPVKNYFTLAQPTIQNIFDTRQAQSSLLTWCGIKTDFMAFMQDHWKNNIVSNLNEAISFTNFWDSTLQKGFYTGTSNSPSAVSIKQELLDIAVQSILTGSKSDETLQFFLYEKVGIGTGKLANNPWLQELPDPLTKAVWDNYYLVNPRYANTHKIKTEDVYKSDNQIDLPVLVQPGQPEGVIGIALGYGREAAGKVGNKKGANVYSLVVFKNGTRQYSGSLRQFTSASKTYPLALTQTHHTMEGRPLIRETILDNYIKDPASGNELHKLNEEKAVTMYKKPVFEGFHWTMSIDLNKCTGCSACIVACQSENNIAVIGKEEVKRRRIMHWIRLDRYYSTSEPDKSGPANPDEIEPDNPEVVFQPVMCQHCDNAPCENVCPVIATVHSSEGLNQMAYNRCIGTRYCVNNCPYRVRRFNWFAYSKNPKFEYNTGINNELGRMVLNPDVTVRSRGVVEKCSFCVQRIQEKKLQAKNEGRPLADGEIQPACMQACPSKAIVFGDLNNKDSRISKTYFDPRSYQLLEELHTLPSIGYLTKVRNKKETGNSENEHS